MSDLIRPFRFRISTNGGAFVGVEIPPDVHEIEPVQSVEFHPGDTGLEEITLTRHMTERDDLYAWMRDSFKTEEPPVPVDIECYQIPRPLLRRLWYRTRMLLGRLVRRWRPRPQWLFKDCVLTRCTVEPDAAVADAAVATITYVPLSREGA